MCGVVGGFSPRVENGIAALRHRGPDAEGMARKGNLRLGHTRLSIIDLDARSNQPFRRGSVVLSYNGELWNWRELRAELESLGEKFHTEGDTEVVAAALNQWGKAALPKLNGMFALAWTDDGGETVRLARDRFGEVPLHLAAQKPFLFASELKALLAMDAHPASLQWVKPGTVVEATDRGMRSEQWYDCPLEDFDGSFRDAASQVRSLVGKGAQERTISDVPVCTLLSGGIDSASVALVLKSYFPDLVAYIAVYDPRSRDLRCARAIAEGLEIELREVKVPLPTTSDLASVIAAAEMPHKAQVEIGWPCLNLARQMREDGFKVTYSGEGSDELWASYGFAYHALKTRGWGEYRRDLYLGQHRKNFARRNKIFMAHSVECRLPFLCCDLAEFALSLPQEIVERGGKMKAVMSEAFRGLLPDEVVDRSKLAFQDGMGIKQRISEAVPDPARYYRAEFRMQFSGADT